MNEKQKVYTVKQIKKYNEELKQNKEERRFHFYGLLISMMIAYICFKGMPGDIDIINEVLSKIEDKAREFIGVFAGVLSVSSVLDIIESLCKKAGIETTIANLEYNLQLAELCDEEPEVKHKL